MEKSHLLSPPPAECARLQQPHCSPCTASWFIALHNTDSVGLFKRHIFFTHVYATTTQATKKKKRRRRRKIVNEKKAVCRGNVHSGLGMNNRRWQPSVLIRMEMHSRDFGRLTSSVRISFCVKSLDVAHLVRKPSKLEMLMSIIFCTNSHCCKAFCKLRCCSSLFVISSFIVFASSGRYFLPRCTFRKKKKKKKEKYFL